MKLIIGFLVSLAVGAGCRLFDIPVPSPPVIPGAILVIAMTLGYSITGKLVERNRASAATSGLYVGPVGTLFARNPAALSDPRSLIIPNTESHEVSDGSELRRKDA